MAVQIQVRRGDAALWTSSNPTLAEGEIGAELDTGRFKIGDGTTAWNSLGYSSDLQVASIIGSRIYTEQNYVTNGETVTSSIDAIDTTVASHLADSANPHNTNKSDVGLGNVDNVKQMPISGGVLENYREKLVSLAGTSTTINLLLGNVFTHTLSGNTTYTITNAVSGQAHSFTLIITQPATPVTLTFPASVKWQGGEIPDLTTASKTYVLTFMSVDGGTNWLGMFGGEF